MTLRNSDLWRVLGYPDGPSRGIGGKVVAATAEPGFLRQEVVVETATAAIPGTLLCPSEAGPRCGAVMYCHAHGNRHDIGRRELLDGRPALRSPYGPALAAAGHIVLCIDMPGFNDRASQGSESSLSKAAMWQGTPLFGRMLADLSAALDYLAGRDDVDASRIATLGLSMGATHAYWLAALDGRIAAAAHLCAFANLKPLIETGAHDLHGHYMTVPGLLKHLDMADVAGMIAPRPQLVGFGSEDPLTPPQAVDPALAALQEVYRRGGAEERLTIVRGQGSGHVETPDMRAAVMRFLDQLA